MKPTSPRQQLRPSAALSRRIAGATAAVAVALLVQGCAAAGLTLLGAGASVGGATAVDHTLTGIAYKSFTVPQADVHTATLKSLDHMGFQVVTDENDENGARVIHAKAEQRDVEVSLERITAKTTRMRVTADQDVPLLKDQATATEIILQTAQALDNRRAAARREAAFVKVSQP